MNLILSIPAQHHKELRGSLEQSNYNNRMNEIKEKSSSRAGDSNVRFSQNFKQFKEKRLIKNNRISEIILNDSKKAVFNKFDVSKSIHSVES